jgi:hypothetical protein
MPTGYTDAIKDGISFKEYALGCARAFGALVGMRDEPFDKEIPQVIKPSDYHLEQIRSTMNEKLELLKMSAKELNDAALVEYATGCKDDADRLLEKLDLKSKYEDMLKKAESYVSPSSDHDEFRNFMISQIEDSVRFDCDVKYNLDQDKNVLLSGADWKEQKLKYLKKDLVYHKEAYDEEVARCKNRTEWIQMMFESLEEYEDVK